jgi:hypothetical protein
MTKDRSPTDYLSDDWGLKKGGDPDSDGGIPARIDMPPNPEWGIGKDGGHGGFGHSDDCKFDASASKWDMTNDEIAKGYSKPGSGSRYGDGRSQDVPRTNEFNRGADFSRRDFAGEEGPDVGTGRDGKSRENLG